MEVSLTWGLGPVYIKRQRSINAMMTLAILFSLKIMEWLENALQPYSWSGSIVFNEVLKSLQSCRSNEAWFKGAPTCIVYVLHFVFFVFLQSNRAPAEEHDERGEPGDRVRADAATFPGDRPAIQPLSRQVWTRAHRDNHHAPRQAIRVKQPMEMLFTAWRHFL